MFPSLISVLFFISFFSFQVSDVRFVLSRFLAFFFFVGLLLLSICRSYSFMGFSEVIMLDHLHENLLMIDRIC